MINTNAHKPGYKHTPLGWIPEEWEIQNAGEVVSYLGGNAFSSYDSYDASGVKWLKIANVGVGTIKWDEASFLPKQYESEYPNYILSVGDIVMALTRPVLNGKLKIGVIGTNDVPSLLNQRVAKLVPKKGIDLKYLYYSHQKPSFVHAMETCMAGSDPPNIGIAELENIVMLIAPEQEQRQIATILSTWDEAIQKTQQLIEQLKQRNKGLMQQLLTGKKRLKGFSGKWNTYDFDDCFKVLRSYSVSRDGLHYDVGSDGIYCIHYGDIHSRYNSAFLDFDLEAKVPQLKSVDISVSQDDYLKNGDVIVADASEDYEGVGAAVEVANLGNMTAVGGLHTIVLRVSRKGIAPGYLAFLFASQHLRNELRKKATGISVYSISKTSLRTLSFQLPDIAEQKAITKALKGATTELKLYEQQLTYLQEQKKGLMQKLLSGEVRVK